MSRELTDAEIAWHRQVGEIKQNRMVEILGQKGIEGFEYKMYAPPSQGSGVTIANGFDFGQHSAADLKRMGFPEHLIQHSIDLGVLGYKGQEAQQRYKELKSANLLDYFTKDEVHLMANLVTEHGVKQLKKEVGAESWDKMTEEQKTAGLSLLHQYGLAAWKGDKELQKKYGDRYKGHNSYKQFVAGDWNGLYQNMMDYKDKTPDRALAINNKHRRVAQYIKPQPMMMASK